MISNQGLPISCENKIAHDLVQMDIGCSSVWVTHAILGQNYIKRTWVALQCGLLIPIWVALQLGLLIPFWVKRPWVALQFGLLMPIWVKPV